MIDLNKKLNKDEFKELLKSNYKFLITDYYLKPNKDNGLYDFYISNLHTLTKEEEKLKEDNRLEIFNLLKAEDLIKIHNLARSNTATDIKEHKFIKINLDTLKSVLNINKYFKNNKNNPDFCLNYGYWMGIYALSSYMLRINSAERNDNMNDLINADYSLFK